MVSHVKLLNKEERERKIREAHYNVFKIRSEDIFIDLLTDSGTTAMSDVQWAAMMIGDEAYASATSWFKLEKTLKDIFGYKYVLPAHQGRGAEKTLFKTLIKPGQTVSEDVTKFLIVLKMVFTIFLMKSLTRLLTL